MNKNWSKTVVRAEIGEIKNRKLVRKNRKIRQKSGRNKENEGLKGSAYDVIKRASLQ